MDHKLFRQPRIHQVETSPSPSQGGGKGCDAQQLVSEEVILCWGQNDGKQFLLQAERHCCGHRRHQERPDNHPSQFVKVIPEGHAPITHPSCLLTPDSCLLTPSSYPSPHSFLP